MTFSPKLAEAFRLAHELHHGQCRRGSEVPYITHLMAVAAIVGEHGGGEDQVVAGLLHDAVEDQGGQQTLELIRSQFGSRVAVLVEGCSDTDVQPKPPWLERKRAFVAAMRHADPQLRLIIAADKLHNTQTILRDLDAVGETVWKRFKGGKEGTLWYYQQMFDALSDGWSHPILDEIGFTLKRLVRKANALEHG